MAKLYPADQDVKDLLKEVVAENHPDMALYHEDVGIVFKPKASKKGGRIVAGTITKAPPSLSALADRDYKYLITLAEDVWIQYNSKDRYRELDHLMLHCQVTMDDKGTNFGLVGPEVVYFFEELERHGHWRKPIDLSEEESEKVRDLLGNIISD